MIWDSKALRSRKGKIFWLLEANLAFRSKASLEYAVPGKSFAVEGGLRLHELEGETEVTPSRRLEIIGRLGAIDCWGTL